MLSSEQKSNGFWTLVPSTPETLCLKGLASHSEQVCLLLNIFMHLLVSIFIYFYNFYLLFPVVYKFSSFSFCISFYFRDKTFLFFYSNASFQSFCMYFGHRLCHLFLPFFFLISSSFSFSLFFSPSFILLLIFPFYWRWVNALRNAIKWRNAKREKYMSERSLNKK